MMQSISDDKDKALLPYEWKGPLYSQVRDRILDRLVKGIWKPGDPLPNEQDLAKEFGVSPGTVRKALDVLVHENLVIRKQGKGTFVATYSSNRTPLHFFHFFGDDGVLHTPTTQLIRSRRRRANSVEMEKLQLSKAAYVIVLDRMRVIDNHPVILETMRYPAQIFYDLDKRPEEKLTRTIYEYIEQEFNIIIHKAEERIKAIAASPEDAELLGIEPGAPLQLIDRVALTPDGIPIEWRSSRCNTSHYHSHVIRV